MAGQDSKATKDEIKKLADAKKKQDAQNARNAQAVRDAVRGK